LDNELVLRQFDEIEKKVEKLLKSFQALEAANGELQHKIENLNAELQGRIEAEKKYAKERDLIRLKIDGLLVKLEDIAEANK
jgi:molecular chaperone GrpE (heat shock protein)